MCDSFSSPSLLTPSPLTLSPLHPSTFYITYSLHTPSPIHLLHPHSSPHTSHSHLYLTSHTSPLAPHSSPLTLHPSQVTQVYISWANPSAKGIAPMRQLVATQRNNIPARKAVTVRKLSAMTPCLVHELTCVVALSLSLSPSLSLSLSLPPSLHTALSPHHLH